MAVSERAKQLFGEDGAKAAAGLYFRDKALAASFTDTRAGWCEHSGQAPRDHVAELQARGNRAAHAVLDLEGQ